MRRLKSSLCRLDRNIERILQLEWSRLDLLLQRLAFEEGHGNEGLAFDFIDLVDVADVGVIKCGGRFRFSSGDRREIGREIGDSSRSLFGTRSGSFRGFLCQGFFN